jgi:hypothetical protein
MDQPTIGKCHAHLLPPLSKSKKDLKLWSHPAGLTDIYQTPDWHVTHIFPLMTLQVHVWISFSLWYNCTWVKTNDHQFHEDSTSTIETSKAWPIFIVYAMRMVGLAGAIDCFARKFDSICNPFLSFNKYFLVLKKSKSYYMPCTNYQSVHFFTSIKS